MESSGRVIFLNGTSSSGKTSIAEQLMEVLETPYFMMPVDAINSMRSRSRTAELDDAGVSEVLERTVLGFHRAVAGMAMAGNGVVVDHVLRERRWLLDCLGVMDGIEVVFVGVRCSLAELERRERERGDRGDGKAAGQFGRVHAHGHYDLECDTEQLRPRECAEKIANFRGEPAAFDRLRAELLTPPAASDR